MIDLPLIIICYTLQIIFVYTYFKAIAYIIDEQLITKKFKFICILISIFNLIIQILLKDLSPFNRIVMASTLFISITFLCKIKILKSIIIASIAPIIQAFIEILVMLIFMSLLNIKSLEIINSNQFILIFYITHSLICISLVLLFKKSITKQTTIIKLKEMFDKKHLKSYSFILIITVVPQLFLIYANNYNFEPTFLTLNFIQLACVSIFCFRHIDANIDRYNLKEQNTSLEMDNKTLSGNVDGVRTLKHDLNNIFQSINGYLCAKEYDDLEIYVGKVMKECNIINTLSIINRNTFNDPAIYGVVGSKYFVATEKNITMDLDVSVNFKEIDFPMAELSRIFGILLDNALEAASKSKDKYIMLEIKFNPRKNANIIRILNSYDTSINIDLCSIFKKGYSSKEVKSGIGLWEVKNLVNKTKNAQIYATIENGKFIQNLIIETCH